MTRRVLCLVVGDQPFAVLPDGRVLVSLPDRRLPFGANVSVTVVYASLKAFLAARRAGAS